MLITASWVERVRAALGIVRVSQIWEEKPAWYFWLSSSRGAYKLALERARWDTDSPSPATGSFSIKYYPNLLEKTFKTFSFQERSAVQSSLFDETGTPRYEAGDRIPESLFNVGAVYCRIAPDNGWTCWTVEALTAMRVVCLEPQEQRYFSIGTTRQFSRGEVDRRVPGWGLAYPFFDRLVGLYAYFRKNAPTRITMTRSPGFEYGIDRSHGYQCTDAPDIHVYELNVYFGEAPESHTSTDKADEPGQTLLDRRYTSAGPRESELLPGGTALNPLWWTLPRTQYKSTLASACGCELAHEGSCGLAHETG